MGLSTFAEARSTWNEPTFFLKWSLVQCLSNYDKMVCWSHLRKELQSIKWKWSGVKNAKFEKICIIIVKVSKVLNYKMLPSSMFVCMQKDIGVASIRCLGILRWKYPLNLGVAKIQWTIPKNFRFQNEKRRVPRESAWKTTLGTRVWAILKIWAWPVTAVQSLKITDTVS